MRLKVEQLDPTLQSNSYPVYIIHGDESLLVEESADKIRQRIRELGANEREVWHVEGRFDWSQIKWQEQSLSLFSTLRLIEIRLPSGSPGKEGGEALRRFADGPPQDTYLLIISGKIDNRSQKAKWFTSLDKLGVNIPVWPVDAAHLPRWIQQRMQLKGLATSPKLANAIAERVEGNLFAAAQEVDKLVLMRPDGKVDEALVLESIADNAKFEAFGLMDMVLAGQGEKLTRILNSLRAEGVDIISILSAVSWTLQRVVDMSVQLEQGTVMEQVFNSQKPPIWEKNKPLMRQALMRYNSDEWRLVLQYLAGVDQAAKGMGTDCPWRLLQNLCLASAGVMSLKETSRSLNWI